MTYIANALIGANPANATWTGGQATSATLGNLAVGATAAQISQLAGKWFLGTDFPSSTSSTSDVGVSYSNTVSYLGVTKPLYGPGGPQMTDVNQGNAGDCFFEAALAEVASQNPSIIQSMITVNGNNTYGVRFYVGGQVEYVTVSGNLANGGATFNKGTALWAGLVEQAYAQLQAGGNVTGGGPILRATRSTPSAMEAGEYAITEVTGATQVTNFVGSGSSWAQYTFASSSFVANSSSAP